MKFNKNELSIKHDIKIEEDINKLCQNCLDMVEIVRTECSKNNKLSGIVSLVDGFKEKMKVEGEICPSSRIKYLFSPKINNYPPKNVKNRTKSE